MNFEDFDWSMLKDILKDKKEVEFEVDREIVGSNLSEKDYPVVPFEIPPTPIAFFEDNLKELLVNAYRYDDVKARWLRVVLYVYAQGGRIVFTKVSSDSLDAKFVW